MSHNGMDDTTLTAYAEMLQDHAMSAHAELAEPAAPVARRYLITDESWVKCRHPKAQLHWVSRTPNRRGGWYVSLHNRWLFSKKSAVFAVPSNAWLDMALKLGRPYTECGPAVTE